MLKKRSTDKITLGVQKKPFFRRVVEGFILMKRRTNEQSWTRKRELIDLTRSKMLENFGTLLSTNQSRIDRK